MKANIGLITGIISQEMEADVFGTFERLVQLVTGMHNIRDVIPFPRYPGNAEF